MTDYHLAEFLGEGMDACSNYRTKWRRELLSKLNSRGRPMLPHGLLPYVLQTDEYILHVATGANFAELTMPDDISPTASNHASSEFKNKRENYYRQEQEKAMAASKIHDALGETPKRLLYNQQGILETDLKQILLKLDAVYLVVTKREIDEAIVALGEKFEPGRKLPAAAVPYGNRPAFYCWSHGKNGTHSSQDCHFPRGSGHQRQATFQNQMGGKKASQARCASGEGKNNNLILDSGASAHLFKRSSKGFLNLRDNNQHQILTPSGHVIRSVQTGDIANTKIPPGARGSIIFEDKDLPNHDLLSVGRLTEHGMQVSFSKEQAVVKNEGGEVALVAHRGDSDLYLIPNGFAGVMFPRSSTTSEKARFYVATMGSPTTSTILDAVRMGWLKLPGLTADILKNHPHSEATARGHLDRTRAELDSSKPKEEHTEKHQGRTIEVSAVQCRIILYTDLARRFPLASARGMEYIMVMKCSDSGHIHMEPLATRSSKEMATAFERGVKFFRSFDRVHLHVRLDNETSVTLKESFKSLSITAKYVAPNNHRQNAAERDIRTSKNHR
jgi:hypothetical protein